MGYLSVSEVAKEISAEYGARVRPRAISDLLYSGQLRDDLCPLMGRVRAIPKTYVPNVAAALKRAGKLAG